MAEEPEEVLPQQRVAAARLRSKTGQFNARSISSSSVAENDRRKGDT
jgi:hypothetical protein